jgi:hypothetical protein
VWWRSLDLGRLSTFPSNTVTQILTLPRNPPNPLRLTHHRLHDGNSLVSRPRLRRGHDVSGHVFLLTMSILFLADQITHSLKSTTLWTAVHNLAVTANVVLIAIWVFATYTTALYFHTPFEKLTGFRTLLFFSCLTSVALTCRLKKKIFSPRYCRVRPYPTPFIKSTPDRDCLSARQQG